MKISGVVLAGGQSSRYGKPKMFEQYNGVPFYQHSVNALVTSGVSPVYIVTNESIASHFQPLQAEVLLEKEQHKGPLYALSYAFEEINHADWLFVLAADIPFVSKEFVNTLLNQISRSEVDAIIPVSGDRLQPLLALYHKRCYHVAKDLLSKGEKSMKPLLQKVKTKSLSFPEDQKDFININYQIDWENEQR
ncbi:molybdenum cofactor guanylyltransferase [Halalkalibacter krulwichiae]|uniref:Probable molybdenum cofactor guanylyltransferase n=1 Tax=Halalkalibacter krulwichiae TaxID=199441 RepID=A0A1X9M6M1_9BACI|nr:molybdenum cofactor guanylyltransferase [Halalkalibacter krulwichiae]ARK29076.1 putative molybdenum cofactor guanylyltransferase [Halalkalibacter krulwichiae]